MRVMKKGDFAFFYSCAAHMETTEEQKVQWQRKILGIGYMMAMGVCGIVLVAIGSNLSSLARNCGTTATHLGTVFIARGVGAVAGAIASAIIYKHLAGNLIMSVALFFLAGLVMILPVISDVFTLHLDVCVVTNLHAIARFESSRRLWKFLWWLLPIRQ